MIKLALNKHKLYNYAFFCPISKLHLTISNPVGFVNEVTPAIMRGLKFNSLIDVDGVIDIETGTVKDAQQAETPVQEESKSSETADNADTEQDNSSEQSEKVAETPAPNEAPKAKKGKSKKEATDTADNKAE